MEWTSRKVLITARGATSILGRQQEKDTIAWTDKHTLSSLNPPLYMVSLPKHHITSQLIEQKRVFVVNFFDKREDLHKVELFDARFHDQFTASSLRKEEAQTIDCSRIQDADHYLECELIESIITGDTITFIGKISKGLI